jgi:hypothetical protein
MYFQSKHEIKGVILKTEQWSDRARIPSVQKLARKISSPPSLFSSSLHRSRAAKIGEPSAACLHPLLVNLAGARSSSVSGRPLLPRSGGVPPGPRRAELGFRRRGHCGSARSRVANSGVPPLCPLALFAVLRLIRCC